jgi:hypothetical protein
MVKQSQFPEAQFGKGRKGSKGKKPQVLVPLASGDSQAAKFKIPYLSIYEEKVTWR